MGHVLSHFEQFGDAAHWPGLLCVAEDLGRGMSLHGKWWYLRYRGDHTSRVGHVSNHFKQFGDSAHGQGLLGVEEDLGLGTA